MKEFLLIFRMDYAEMPQGTTEQIQATTMRWMDWIKSISLQNKLVDRGNRLMPSGKLVKGNNIVVNGPYTEIKESIGGYTLIRTDSYDDAIVLAKACPILTVGGNVEVREILPI
jgi:hypothetical protein